MSDHLEPPIDVAMRLEELEQLVADAKAVPLSASIMINRSEVETLVHDIRAVMPDELAQARWVVRERDEILDRAQADADRLLDDARAEQARLVSEEAVVLAAHQEAERVLGEAREHARQIRLEAEDYVDAKLANFEVVLHKTLGAVERGRLKLRGRLDTDALTEEDLDPETSSEP
jgi:cell division septum initiation protein DivIVA